MSYDFATLQVCKHTIVDESSILDSETRSRLTFQKQPISGVSVTVDGNTIPANGLFGKQSVVFARKEPYRITKNVSDLIYVANKLGEARYVELPPGLAISAKTLTSYLNIHIPEAAFVVKNGHVVAEPKLGETLLFKNPRLVDPAVSLPATTRVEGCYRDLGIIAGREARYTLIYPGWKVESNDVLNEYYLVFDNSIRNSTPVVNLTYNTIAPFCSRCQGSTYEFDYRVVDSSYETVRNTDLLAQELDKFMFTQIGSHFKWRWLGSDLFNQIGGKSLDASSRVNLDITNAFATYQNIKTQQASTFRMQNVTDAEFPASILRVNSSSPPDDPTVVVADILISNRAQQEVPLTRVIGNPDPLSLAGTSSAYIFRG